MDTTPGVTLTEFLLARFDEVEAVARAAADAPTYTINGYRPTGETWSASLFDYAGTPAGMVMDSDGYGLWDNEGSGTLSMDAAVASHVAAHDPAYVLADLEAKRVLVSACAPYDDDMVRRQTRNLARVTLRGLAAPFAAHPGYLAEWAFEPATTHCTNCGREVPFNRPHRVGDCA